MYALDEDTKQWADRGTSGTVIMFQNNSNREDVRIKWEKDIRSQNQQTQHLEIWWRLTSSKLKPKGERALVLKAWATISNQQEILAIRFSHQDAAIQFAKKYQGIFPMSISGQYQIENIFKQSSSSNQQNGMQYILNIYFVYFYSQNRMRFTTKYISHRKLFEAKGSFIDGLITRKYLG